MTRRLLAVVVLLAVAVAGCSGPTQLPAPAGTSSSAAVPRPRAIEVPSIGVSSSLISTGLNPDGTIATPDVHQPLQASWFDQSPAPGQIGPAVVLGHVNGEIDGKAGQPGVFARLHLLHLGDLVDVDLDNGATAVFVVEDIATVDKDAFPTARVYGDVHRPELRLITCGGAFDHRARSYTANVVAFAVLTDLVTTTRAGPAPATS